MSNPPTWHRVKEVFQAVLERPAEERAAALQTLCTADPELRAEVEALLAAHAQGGSIVERPAIEWLSSLSVESSDLAAELPLRAGDRLGPYEVESKAGAGGMGDVYRARDTRLGRMVAIKMLPAHLRVDQACYERFEREARAVARLDHAHIGALYDVGQDRGRPFLVMQCVDGDTLAARLAKGPLPIDQALRCAVEIASALDHAHRRGIVHRDLKPSNVMLTKSGAKLLDFGVARWRIPPGVGPPGRSSNPQRTLTETGAIVGTVQYMAPEQVEGKEADERTDIFAFGALIYEMTTGRRAFEADTQAGLFAAIVGSDPAPISALRPDVPASLERLVRKCLAKDPDARWQSASDLADELSWISDLRSEAPGASLASGRSRSHAARAWLLAFLVSVIAAGAAGMLTSRRPSHVRPLTRFIVELPPGVQVPVGYAPALALSPDGRHLAYAATRAGGTQVFVRAMNEVESKPIAGTEGGEEPFFSPDSQWIAFLSGSGLKRVALSGGAPIIVVSGRQAVGASWGPDDRIVFGGNRAGLSVVSASGGPQRALTTLDGQRGETSHRHPDVLPSGRAVIFTNGLPASGSWDDAEIVAQALDTGERHVLIRGGTQARYVSTGHLVYARAATLFAVPFDARALRVTGPPVAVLEGVAANQTTGAAQFTISAGGSLAYVTGGLRRTDVMWVDRRGRAEPLITGQGPRYFYQPRLSPNGQRLAITVAGADDDIWVYDIAHGALSRFTSGGNHIAPAWTPDGRYVTYTRDLRLFRRPSDRSGPEEELLANLGFPHSSSPDGRLLMLTRVSPTTGPDIWMVRLEDRIGQPLLQTPFAELTPMLSPDGRWLAYTSDETGRLEVYVQPFPGPGRRTQISRDGGTEPRWARDGKELFFRQGESLMVAAIANGSASGRPQVLFSSPSWFGTHSRRTNYDVAPDGQRFVMLWREPGAAEGRIHVVLNWVDELTRQVPR